MTLSIYSSKIVRLFFILLIALLCNIPKTISNNILPSFNIDYKFQTICLLVIFLFSLKNFLKNKQILFDLYIITIIFILSWIFKNFDNFSFFYFISVIYLVLALNFYKIRVSDKYTLTKIETLFFIFCFFLPTIGYYIFLGGSYGYIEGVSMNSTRITGPFGGSIIVGLLASFSFIFILVNDFSRIIKFIFSVFFLFVIFYSGSRGALIIFISLLLYYYFPKLIKLKTILKCLLIGFIIIFISLLFIDFQELFNNRVFQYGLGSDNERISKISTFLNSKISEQNGMGSSLFWSYNKYTDVSTFEHNIDPHNLYVGLFGELGFLFPLFVLILIRKQISIAKNYSRFHIALFLGFVLFSFFGSDFTKNPSILVFLLMISNSKILQLYNPKSFNNK